MRELEYINKARKIICEEGLLALVRKAWKFMSLPTRFDKYITKLLSKYSTKGFHKLFYYSFFCNSGTPNIYWMGVPVMKCPLDMWIYQEIIYETKPEVIIETGTASGGSALFFASIFDLIKSGQVITIDIADNCKISHPRIKKIIGNSVSNEVINKVEKLVKNKKTMVVLDSDHSKTHVLREMEVYSKFVSLGNYLVIEDTNINGHPVLPGWGDGPMEAVREFLRTNDEYEIDYTREKFFLTFYPCGFLKRIKQNKE